MFFSHASIPRTRVNVIFEIVRTFIDNIKLLVSQFCSPLGVTSFSISSYATLFRLSPLLSSSLTFLRLIASSSLTRLHLIAVVGLGRLLYLWRYVNMLDNFRGTFVTTGSITTFLVSIVMKC